MSHAATPPEIICHSSAVAERLLQLSLPRSCFQHLSQFNPCDVVLLCLFRCFPLVCRLFLTRLGAVKQPRSWAGVSDGGRPKHGQTAGARLGGTTPARGERRSAGPRA